MEQVAYLYLPTITADEIVAVFNTLEQHGFEQSHIGKRDPPKKRRVTLESAIAIILEASPSESSNYSFVADKRSGIDLTFLVRPNLGQGFSSVSISFPEQIPALTLCEALFSRTRALACISGRLGAGKHQHWLVSLIAPTCPERLRATLAGV